MPLGDNMARVWQQKAKASLFIHVGITKLLLVEMRSVSFQPRLTPITEVMVLWRCALLYCMCAVSEPLEGWPEISESRTQGG